jgi:predicted nuclease of predicted toxin-antitoxin system
MKILFDQGTPVPLRQWLAGHTTKTAYEEGWSNLSNGELLNVAEEAGYQVFVTTDQNLRYQQNLRERPIAIVVRLSTFWPRIRPYAENICEVIRAMRSGGYVEIPIQN